MAVPTAIAEIGGGSRSGQSLLTVVTDAPRS
jgi:hypothetical protein